ncbi:SPRY domain-containing protein 4 [Latimeria chalumnae]|uniref:SPRY domain containing 4 n=1 Tax=Latimeria chalumnae TaxID=7897 RepID=H3BIC1_LATCH|nr:PREDICTED: SPRY domain-containing protein 4 [Latimeria chalumnae]|eukprot:XP_005986312.1 PREDICTED: SPRY domain-containing protein 4 [Latimeria chalumnae]
MAAPGPMLLLCRRSRAAGAVVFAAARRSWGFSTCGRSYVTQSQRKCITFKLDEKTAHNSLDLFKKDTGVIYRMLGVDPTKVPQNPERFQDWAVVLGDSPVTRGRHYWEITVKRSQEFRIGVADTYMSREECIGANDCSWVYAYLHKKWYAMVANKTTPLNMGRPDKVGLFLDYEGGKLSLVQLKPLSLVHTITAEFKNPVVPAFALWDGELLTHSELSVPENL